MPRNMMRIKWTASSHQPTNWSTNTSSSNKYIHIRKKEPTLAQIKRAKFQKKKESLEGSMGEVSLITLFSSSFLLQLPSFWVLIFFFFCSEIGREKIRRKQRGEQKSRGTKEGRREERGEKNWGIKRWQRI